MTCVQHSFQNCSRQIRETFEMFVQPRKHPHNPRISPCDFRLFSRLKILLPRYRFFGKETFETNITVALKGIPKTEFQNYCREHKHQWEHLVQPNWVYFEECHQSYDEKNTHQRAKMKARRIFSDYII